MGIFGKLFGGDPQKDLAKAQGFLEAGRPDRALDAARKLVSTADEEIRSGAEAVVAGARKILIDKALQTAATSEDSEFWEDALDWYDRALEQIEDPARKAEVAAKRRALVDRLDASEEEEWQAPEPVVEPEEDASLSADQRFETLVDILADEVGRQYLAQEESFRDAYLASADGRPEEALPLLDELLAKHPDDPVLRFERGSARFYTDDPQGARQDLEKAQESWGDIFLDRAGTLSVTGLWAEALLELGEVEPILDRLEKAARPTNNQPGLSLLYARALITAGRLEDAESFLVKASGLFPSRTDFAFLLSELLTRTDRRSEAIYCLEAAIAPSCSGGSCGKVPRHLPSFRSLCVLLLEEVPVDESAKFEEARLDRVEELLNFIRDAQGGALTVADLLLHARLSEARGDEEEAEKYRKLVEEAGAAAAEQREVMPVQAPKMSGEAVL